MSEEGLCRASERYKRGSYLKRTALAGLSMILGSVALAACYGQIGSEPGAGQGATGGGGQSAAGATGSGSSTSTSGSAGSNTSGPTGGVSSTGATGSSSASSSGGTGSTGVDETDPGSVVMHRLNQVEYNNTVRDLFSTTIALPDDFPPDDVGDGGFDNVAEALSVTDVHLGFYVSTASALATEALSASRRATLVSCDLKAQQETCVQSTLQKFLPRAWRRPVDDSDYTALVGIYTANKAAGATEDESLRRVIQAALIAPEFLYRIEYNKNDDGAEHPLDGYELASRLSYLIWSSMPDDELLAAAASGMLADPDQLKAQAERMLKDKKASALSNFGDQWLPVRKLDTASPNSDLFPKFNDGIRAAMKQELTLLFADVASGDLPVNQLLTANYSYLNDGLATYYGLPKVGSTTPVRAQVPMQRTGLLTKGALLTALAHSDQTSPVRRGNWVLGQLLCAEVPPPPFMPPAEPAPMAGQTRKDILAMHRSVEPCKTCHSLMDPPGLALEQYDAAGQYRTKDEQGLTIDPSGQLKDGTSFQGPNDLEDDLANGSQVPRCVAQHAFIYALGRAIRSGSMDDEVIDQATASFTANGQKFPDLIESMILSDVFRQRKDSN